MARGRVFWRSMLTLHPPALVSRWELDQCVGQTGGIPRIDFPAMCLQDGPLGIRYGMALVYTILSAPIPLGKSL